MLQILSSKTYKDIVKIHTTKRNNIKFENSWPPSGYTSPIPILYLLGGMVGEFGFFFFFN